MLAVAAEVLALRPPRKATARSSPPGLVDGFVREAAEAIIRLAAEQPDLVRRVFEALRPASPAAGAAALLMKKAEYATRAGYSVRTLDKFIAAGLPVRGRAKRLRVVVKAADDWLLEHDAADLDEVDLLAMQNAQKDHRTGHGGG